MFRVLGNCIQDGIVAKLADDLYCGGNTLDELLSDWKKSLGCTTEIQFKVAPLQNSNYAPNFEEVAGAYWFRVARPSVRSSKTMHARVLKFHIWIPQGKIVDAHSPYFPELWPFENLGFLKFVSKIARKLFELRA